MRKPTLTATWQTDNITIVLSKAFLSFCQSSQQIVLVNSGHFPCREFWNSLSFIFQGASLALMTYTKHKLRSVRSFSAHFITPLGIQDVLCSWNMQCISSKEKIAFLATHCGEAFTETDCPGRAWESNLLVRVAESLQTIGEADNLLLPVLLSRGHFCSSERSVARTHSTFAEQLEFSCGN